MKAPGFFSRLAWKFFIWKVVRTHGLKEPFLLLSQMKNFLQPSEVFFPEELFRAGALLQVRGMINSVAIQHNLDWLWPFWVERQFDPEDEAFIPRAFSIAHINLTHRNWTAVGIPGIESLPIVDPRGMVTPIYAGWSIECWVIKPGEQVFSPQRAYAVSQKLLFEDNLCVETGCEGNGVSLTIKVDVEEGSGSASCRMNIRVKSEDGGRIAVALRPYNPEGVSFIHKIAVEPDRKTWIVNKHNKIHFDSACDAYAFSIYERGDVFNSLMESSIKKDSASCDVGMATSAALFSLKRKEVRDLSVFVPLGDTGVSFSEEWKKALENSCSCQLPDKAFKFLYEAALRTVILHTPREVYAGPFTYKRFWFRDAAFILNALLCLNLHPRVFFCIHNFLRKQTIDGYFLSQNGEWDSNGQALWIVKRYADLSGQPIPEEWSSRIKKAARWICRKRLKRKPGKPYSGLLPAGFSAEHFGPNDYYYWDDFWGIAGLRSAASLLESIGDTSSAALFSEKADSFFNCVEESLETVSTRIGYRAIPASCHRRMDSAAVGSLIASYPLQLFAERDERIINTIAYLTDNCLIKGGFFHVISHSGINAYLTLHMAQALLRAGDTRFISLIRAVARLASPTGQWPEAIHPRTMGGCMGDGQHVWAAAEWLLAIRNLFVREEGNSLIIASGIPREWLASEEKLYFGPTLTPFGKISVKIEPDPASKKARISWQGDWYKEEPPIEIRLPGTLPVSVKPGADSMIIYIKDGQ